MKGMGGFKKTGNMKKNNTTASIEAFANKIGRKDRRADSLNNLKSSDNPHRTESYTADDPDR